MSQQEGGWRRSKGGGRGARKRREDKVSLGVPASQPAMTLDSLRCPCLPCPLPLHAPQPSLQPARPNSSYPISSLLVRAGPITPSRAGLRSMFRAGTCPRDGVPSKFMVSNCPSQAPGQGMKAAAVKESRVPGQTAGRPYLGVAQMFTRRWRPLVTQILSTLLYIRVMSHTPST